MQTYCKGPCGTLGHHRSAQLLSPPRTPVFKRSVQADGPSASRLRVDTRATAGDFGSTAREPNYDSVNFRQDSGSTASTSAVIDVTNEQQKESRLEEVKEFLREELHRIFSGGVSLTLCSAFDLLFCY